MKKPLIRYYGIKTPGKPEIDQESYIYWIGNSEHEAWMAFFHYPKNGERGLVAFSLSEAIEAYEAIGYRCVELEVKELNV